MIETIKSVISGIKKPENKCFRLPVRGSQKKNYSISFEAVIIFEITMFLVPGLSLESNGRLE